MLTWGYTVCQHTEIPREGNKLLTKSDSTTIRQAPDRSNDCWWHKSMWPGVVWRALWRDAAGDHWLMTYPTVTWPRGQPGGTQAGLAVLRRCLRQLFLRQRASSTETWAIYMASPRARFTNKVKSIIMSLNFSSSQLARISLAEFVSKLILIWLDIVCEPGPVIYPYLHYLYRAPRYCQVRAVKEGSLKHSCSTVPFILLF